MNLRKIRSRKALQLLGLLISSLLIATASAAYYTEMFMYATVTVEGKYVEFVSAGNTTELGGTVTAGGEEVTFTNMKGYNGSLAPWIEAVNITNTHASTGYNITLQLDNWDGDSETTLRYINVTMYDEGDTQKGNKIHLVPGAGDVDTTGQQVLSAGDMWRVQWDIWWWGNATTNTIDVTIKLIVED